MVVRQPRAGVYARISSDPDDTRLGVERQEQDCRDLAKRKGWTVVDTFVDNDFSAATVCRLGDPDDVYGCWEQGVWYRWTAPVGIPTGATVTFTTAGSNFNTTIGAYVGCSVSTLAPAAHNDDFPGLAQQSQVAVPATPGGRVPQSNRRQQQQRRCRGDIKLAWTVS